MALKAPPTEIFEPPPAEGEGGVPIRGRSASKVGPNSLLTPSKDSQILGGPLQDRRKRKNSVLATGCRLRVVPAPGLSPYVSGRRGMWTGSAFRLYHGNNKGLEEGPQTQLPTAFNWIQMFESS